MTAALKSFTINVVLPKPTSFKIEAPDRETAQTRAANSWREHNARPIFTVSAEEDIPPDTTKTYDVRYTITEEFSHLITASSMEEALAIGRAIRDNTGSCEGDFETVSNELSDLEVVEVKS